MASSHIPGRGNIAVDQDSRHVRKPLIKIVWPAESCGVAPHGEAAAWLLCLWLLLWPSVTFLVGVQQRWRAGWRHRRMGRCGRWHRRGLASVIDGSIIHGHGGQRLATMVDELYGTTWKALVCKIIALSCFFWRFPLAPFVSARCLFQGFDDDYKKVRSEAALFHEKCTLARCPSIPPHPKKCSLSPARTCHVSVWN